MGGHGDPPIVIIKERGKVQGAAVAASLGCQRVLPTEKALDRGGHRLVVAMLSLTSVSTLRPSEHVWVVLDTYVCSTAAVEECRGNASGGGTAKNLSSEMY
eukprot:5660416-Pleurochrysis_carterae.AAC.1